jgi:hypothetical protein
MNEKTRKNISAAGLLIAMVLSTEISEQVRYTL